MLTTGQLKLELELTSETVDGRKLMVESWTTINFEPSTINLLD
jgi:hypothetical protein